MSPTKHRKAQKSTVPMPPHNDQPHAESGPKAPEITAISRVASIPLVNGAVDLVVNTINQYPITRSGYNTAKGISTSIYQLTEPLQIRLAPVIVYADGCANKGIDIAQSQFPSAFETKPEDVTSYVNTQKENVEKMVQHRRESTHKLIDENVITPAYAVAEGIDKRCSILVDAFQSVVDKTQPEGQPTTPIESKYQYQRALALSKNLRDNVYTYSNEQVKQIHDQSVLVQRATATAAAVSETTSASIASVQQQVVATSNRMIAELQNLQASTKALAASLQASASNTIHNGTAQLQNQIPPNVQQIYTDYSTKLNENITQMRSIISEDIPAQDKVKKLVQEVNYNIQPLLERMANTLPWAKQPSSDNTHSDSPSHSQPRVNGINGVNGTAH